MSMLLKEWKALLTNRKVLIPVIAVLFIPVLYSGMFLWAFWDPYSQLSELPVAVVNEDSGAQLQGKNVQVGSDLVEKLKENDQFQWKFVDRQKGEQGLKNQEYYMLIEIPEDASSNAVTLLNEHPEKIELVYTPNEGFNFLSAQIGETAVDRIKGEVSAELTKTYAEGIFANIEKLGDGLWQASEGAERLSEGSSEVENGTRAIKENLQLLAESSITFKDGLAAASGGAEDVTEGVTSLEQGLGQLQEGQRKLSLGTEQAAEGSAQLSGGLASSLSGLKEMQEKSPALTEGSSRLYSGLNASLAGMKEMEAKVPALTEGTGSLADGLSQSLSGLREMEKNAPLLTEGTKNISGGADRLSSELQKASEGNKQAQQGAKEIAEGLEQLSSSLQALMPALDSLPETQRQELSASLKALTEGSRSLEGNLGKLAQGTEQLSGGAGELSAKMLELQQGQSALAEGLSRAAAGQESLYKGAKELQNGQAALQEGIAKAAEGQERLAAGAAQLSKGSEALSNGIDRVTAGQEQLYAGASGLQSGLGELSDGHMTLSEKLAEAKAGSGMLAGGSRELSSGISRLAEGSNELQKGSSQLADGAGALNDGAAQLAEGTGELSGKLADAAKATSEVNGSEDLYSMVSKPVEIKNERINAVPNYGTGFAPYFISLGLFVGALLLSIVFPLREPAGTPSSGFGWFLSKFGILAVVGVIQALIADAILLFGLGIEVQHTGLFILFSIITSITFIALIQFLVTSLGDPGRFAAILILILQLTTSAGTFPLELIPLPLQSFHEWLPMTYSVAGFKAVISTGDHGFMWSQAWILLSFASACMLGTFLYFTAVLRKRKNAQQEVVKLDPVAE
ncbi:DUF3533 domain-containing protein [Bacillus lacus]|uniref:DUF3533 domain-containing protein n=1 Tax=Metabacillus lacus TaxID=1983721 RepID=A0A7X2IXE9_9BACI|nr:YhgE/Pip domain-containing protein [Metabacillus lacus]MRX71444.1 DUF3533 domain-containing protein [Metabacillus lacus]